MPNSPHDALFRYTFGQPEHAATLLRAILPPALSESLDWSTLTLLPGTRIDRRLRRHQTDLLFSVHGKKGRVLIHVLVEHSSRIERFMAFRMIDYAVGIWRQLLRQRPRPKRLPWIVPVVVYHGRRGWSATTEFAELLEPSDEESPWQQPRFRYVLESFRGMQPDELDGLALSVLGTVTLAALQHLPLATAPQAFEAFARWGGLLRRLLQAPSGEEAMAALSEYVLTTARVAPEALIQVVEQEVNRRASKIMETTATRLLRTGREEGRAELLTRLLEARFGPLPKDMHERLSRASTDETDRWALRLLAAKNLAEVFAD